MSEQAWAKEQGLHRTPPKHSASAGHQPHTTALGLQQDTLQRALADPKTLSPTDVMQLQRAMGNRAVCRLLGRDGAGSSGAAPTVQRAAGAEGGVVSSQVEAEIRQAQGGGRPLPDTVREGLEKRMGISYDNVRIHTDAKADRLSRSLNAEAFTLGTDTYFRKGAYSPSSHGGKQLLTHEMTHVAQQTGGHQKQIQTKLQVGPANDRFEQEADSMAAHPSSSAPATMGHPRMNSANTIQRKLKFTVGDLSGLQLSQTAIANEKVRRKPSALSKIMDSLKKYWATNSHVVRYQCLKDLSGYLAEWMSKHGKKKSGSQKHVVLQKLQLAVSNEMNRAGDKAASQEYMEKYNMNNGDVTGLRKKYPSSLYTAVGTDPFANGIKQGRELHKAGNINNVNEEQSKSIAMYKTNKNMKLLPAERAALQSYSTEQYKLINPAMAGDMEWYKKGMENADFKNFKWDQSDKGIKTGIADNQEIGGMLSKGLKKLPPWKQTKTIYRGETLPQAEADAMKKGTQKKYGYFVSTSQQLDTPKKHAADYRTKTRPVGVVYHIVDSEGGKDIAAYSMYKTEEEILFPPGTILEVMKIISNKDNIMEVEVKVSAPNWL